MKITILFVSIFIGTICAVTTPAYSCPMHQGSAKHDMSTEDIFFKKMRLVFDNQDSLKLTDEQLAKIKKLKLDTKKSVIMKDAEIEVKKIDITSLMHESSTDLGAVNTLIDQKYELKKQKDKAVTAALLEIKNILTQQQKDTLKSLFMNEHPKHHSKRMMK